MNGEEMLIVQFSQALCIVFGFALGWLLHWIKTNWNKIIGNKQKALNEDE